MFVLISCLFFSEIDGDRHSVEIPYFAHSVLNKPSVRVAYVLRQVAEEYKLRIRCRQLGDIFYLYPFAFYRGWGILFLHYWQEVVVQLTG